MTYRWQMTCVEWPYKEICKVPVGLIRFWAYFDFNMYLDIRQSDHSKLEKHSALMYIISLRKLNSPMCICEQQQIFQKILHDRETKLLDLLPEPYSEIKSSARHTEWMSVSCWHHAVERCSLFSDFGESHNHKYHLSYHVCCFLTAVWLFIWHFCVYICYQACCCLLFFPVVGNLLLM